MSAPTPWLTFSMSWTTAVSNIVELSTFMTYFNLYSTSIPLLVPTSCTRSQAGQQKRQYRGLFCCHCCGTQCQRWHCVCSHWPVQICRVFGSASRRGAARQLLCRSQPRLRWRYAVMVEELYFFHQQLSYQLSSFHPRYSGQYPGDGTTLVPLAGRGNASAPPFVTISANGALRGVVIWHAEQVSHHVPVPYPFAVALVVRPNSGQSHGQQNLLPLSAKVAHTYHIISFEIVPCRCRETMLP